MSISAETTESSGRRRTATGLILLAMKNAFLIGRPAAAATFTVNSTLDARDARAGDGLCATSSGVCSLRAAIEEANALAGADNVVLPGGVNLITLGNGDDKAERGDFDNMDAVAISGYWQHRHQRSPAPGHVPGRNRLRCRESRAGRLCRRCAGKRPELKLRGPRKRCRCHRIFRRRRPEQRLCRRAWRGRVGPGRDARPHQAHRHHALYGLRSGRRVPAQGRRPLEGIGATPECSLAQT